MSTFVVLALLGLGQGAMYAAMAVGLVVTYRGTGVVNLAYATMAAFPAMAYHLLVTEGTLAFPWIVIPSEIHLGHRVPALPAFVLAVGVGLLLGALTLFLGFRPLRDEFRRFERQQEVASADFRAPVHVDGHCSLPGLCADRVVFADQPVADHEQIGVWYCR